MQESATDRTPEEVLNIMLHNDYFTEWLGLEVTEISLGKCTLTFNVKKEMLNGFHSIHGGILFSAADSAFAFACNSHGKINVALDCSMTYTRPAFEGEVLTVAAEEIHKGKTTGLYEITILNESKKLVAKFKGVSYNTGRMHEALTNKV